MGVLAAGVGKMDADMGLEGPLVGREPGVAVYPEERAACGARVGDEMRAELAQVRPEAADERQRRIANDLFISLLVPGEPVAVVVALELAQKLEEVGPEECVIGHQRHLQPFAWWLSNPPKLVVRGEQRQGSSGSEHCRGRRSRRSSASRSSR